MGEKKEWNLGFAGFGRVSRALLRLLDHRREELRERWGLSYRVTMIATATRGALVDGDGIDPAAAFEGGWKSKRTTLEAIARAPIDLLFEGTTLDPVRGEPALSHVRTALERGVSVVSANKGPIAFAVHELTRIARGRGAGFRFESAVADCLPVFDLFEVVLPVGRVTSFRGVLNSTSNLVLQAVARGDDLQEAIAAVQRQGLTEADPAHDLDGHDQAVKAVILSNVLMGRDLRPGDVRRVPFGAVDLDWVRREERAGRRVRLAASGTPGEPPEVAPVSLPSGSFLGSLAGGSLGLILETELAGILAVGSVEPQVEQTAYGMLSDLVAIHQGRLLIPPPCPPLPS